MSAPAAPRGRLFLVPAPLDFGCEGDATDLRDVLPDGTLRTAATLTHWVAENAKTARAYLKRIDALYPLAQPIQSQSIAVLPRDAHKKGDHGPSGAKVDAKALLAHALQGHDVGLMSECGMPAVADPGSSIVRAAHDLGLTVVPLVGPVSLLLALAASGLNGQHFAFVGYLPQDAAERAKRIRELEALALQTGQTQLFIETPYRNAALLDALLAALKPSTRLSISAGLTLADADTVSATVQQHRAQPPAARLGERIKRPCVFALGG